VSEQLLDRHVCPIYPFDEDGTRELIAADRARGMNPGSSHGSVLNAASSRVEGPRRSAGTDVGGARDGRPDLPL
jgi:hypothetical protein